MSPSWLEDPVIIAIAKRVNKTPAQASLTWVIPRETAPPAFAKKPGRINGKL